MPLHACILYVVPCALVVHEKQRAVDFFFCYTMYLPNQTQMIATGAEDHSLAPPFTAPPSSNGRGGARSPNRTCPRVRQDDDGQTRARTAARKDPRPRQGSPYRR